MRDERGVKYIYMQKVLCGSEREGEMYVYIWMSNKEGDNKCIYIES